MLRTSPRTISDIVSLANSGRYSGSRDKLFSLAELNKSQIKQELTDRMSGTYGTVEQMRGRLRELRQGVAHFPGWLTFNSQTLESSGLEFLEVPAAEPLHILKGHIDNIFKELQHKHYGAASLVVREFYMEEFGKKAIIRGRDYRNAVPKLAVKLSESNVNEEIYQLIKSLADIAYLMYISSSARSNKTVLQAYNFTIRPFCMLCSWISSLEGSPKQYHVEKCTGCTIMKSPNMHH